MALSDGQLMLLEQLTYANKDLFNELGVTYSSPAQALEQIKNLSYDDIYALSKKGKIKNHTMTGEEWADILCAIKSDPDLMNLKCVSYDDKSKGYCYLSSSGETYVTFRGTDGPDEWKDDAEGLGMADTPCQKYALDYIENLPYDNIAVVGHSKGGNKAQYVTITSDKVNRCVSMDGQGFSKEFIDKYWAEIEKKGKLINNYSYNNDYVHILMNYIPGSQQIYCTGGHEITGKECHNPDGMINIEYDQDTKKWNVYFVETEENSAMTYLHEFTCFVTNNMPIAERQKVGEYIGYILAMTLSDGVYFFNGEKYDKNNIVDFIERDPESAAIIIAYLFRYFKEYKVSREEARALIKALGLDATIDIDKIWDIVESLKIDDNPQAILSLIKIVLDMPGIDGGVYEDIVNMAAKKYTEIKVVSGTANSDYQSRTDTKRDFTDNSLTIIINAINSINDSTFDNSSSWTAYAGEKWYAEISAGMALKGINKYFEKLYTVNSKSETQISNIYQSVYSLDSTYSKKIKNQVNIMDGNRASISSLSDNIG